jgi:hypothetical protein
VLELLKGLLGLAVGASGSMRLHDEVVDLASCVTSTCTVNVSLPLAIASTWPSGLSRIELGGINAGIYRNVSIDCVVQYSHHEHGRASSGSSSNAPLIALTYAIAA